MPKLNLVSGDQAVLRELEEEGRRGQAVFEASQRVVGYETEHEGDGDDIDDGREAQHSLSMEKIDLIHGMIQELKCLSAEAISELERKDQDCQELQEMNQRHIRQVSTLAKKVHSERLDSRRLVKQLMLGFQAKCKGLQERIEAVERERSESARELRRVSSQSGQKRHLMSTLKSLLADRADVTAAIEFGTDGMQAKRSELDVGAGSATSEEAARAGLRMAAERIDAAIVIVLRFCLSRDCGGDREVSDDEYADVHGEVSDVIADAVWHAQNIIDLRTGNSVCIDNTSWEMG